jgi:hypothetical protein
MRLHTHRTFWALGLLLGAVGLSWLAWSAQAGRASSRTTALSPAASDGSESRSLRGEQARQYLKERGLYDRLRASIEASRYEINWRRRASPPELGGAYEATNPGQGLRAYFTPTEMRLIPDASDLPGGARPQRWRFGMKLRGYGYGKQIQPLAAGFVTVKGNRIEIQKSAGAQPQSVITEWYINRKEGLEQGFTLTAPPGVRMAEPLRLALAVTGGLKASLAEAGQAVVLTTRAGKQVLRYDHLAVQDALGRSLPAHLAVEGDEVSLLVDDTLAVYPVTIDPLFTQVKKLTTSDAATGDGFGYSVGISGDTAVVGAYGKNSGTGAAYIYARNQGGANNWGEVKKLPHSDAAMSDSFGNSVGISGDTVVVGAFVKNSFNGGAYIYARNQGGVDNWGEVKKLVPSNVGTNDVFGNSVGISGDTVVVGAPGENFFHGAAYIYARNQGGADNWGQVKKLSASDTVSPDAFGFSVGIDGDTIVVGAPGKNSQTGAAYIFARNQGGANNWGEVQKLTANDGVTNDRFGYVVGISGDTVVVGAFNNLFTGAAYIFTTFSPPLISKAFNPTIIPLDGTASLSFTISNPAGNTVALTGVAFTDNLPAGLVVATPNALSNTCGGTVTAVSGSSTISLSGGMIAAGGSCTISVNVTGTTPGAKNNSVQVTSNNGGTGNTATATVTVGAAPLSASIADPFGCTGPGDVLTVTVTTSNLTLAAQTASFTATLPASLVGLPGTGTATVGAPPTVSATSASYTATLAPGQSTTVTYQVQVGDVASGTQLCITTALIFGGAPSGSVQACATINCPAVGPGVAFPATGEVGDQRAGSVLVYNLYSSSIAAPSAQNTRIAITNTHPNVGIAVHLFFVDGATCSIADSLICLTANQTASFLASDIDPGTTGYIVAVASDLVTGCPVNFNFLIGDEYVKLSSGHAANLAAEGFAALAGGLPACDASSVTTILNFDGVSYNRAPRTLAASNLPSRADGNDTLLVLNRIGGSLVTGAATLSNLFGILYDDAENPLSFSFSPGGCQFRSSLSNNFPRIAPRFDQFIPAGRSGWAKFYATGELGLLGAQINFNPNAGTAANAFNQGHNLHKLTLTQSVQLTIPIFPPNC